MNESNGIEMKRGWWIARSERDNFIRYCGEGIAALTYVYGSSNEEVDNIVRDLTALRDELVAYAMKERVKLYTVFAIWVGKTETERVSFPEDNGRPHLFTWNEAREYAVAHKEDGGFQIVEWGYK